MKYINLSLHDAALFPILHAMFFSLPLHYYSPRCPFLKVKPWTLSLKPWALNMNMNTMAKVFQYKYHIKYIIVLHVCITYGIWQRSYYFFPNCKIDNIFSLGFANRLSENWRLSCKVCPAESASFPLWGWFQKSVIRYLQKKYLQNLKC